MPNQFRLVYASEANVKNLKSGVNPEIGRILSVSKRNNARRGIGGVLYYGDGYFFQVLEGDKEPVQTLFSKICNDPRHKNAMVLDTSEIKRRLFADWSMQFIPNKSAIRKLLKEHGFRQFTPLDFNIEITRSLVQHFHESLHQGKKATKPQTNWIQRFLGRFSPIASRRS